INPGGGWAMFVRADPSRLPLKNQPPRGLSAEVTYNGPVGDVLGHMQMEIKLARDGIPLAINSANLKPHDWFPIEILARGDQVDIKISGGGLAASKFKPSLPPGPIILQLPNANTALEFR